MNEAVLSVREIQKDDIGSIIQYWVGAESHFLNGMGVDINKIPGRDEWTKMLLEQIASPIEEKRSYCIIWLAAGIPIGHSNINKIVFGDEAFMHLHLWDSHTGKKGTGTGLIQMTLPYYFEKFKLKKLYCEPYALNPAPNKTLAKVGFEHVKTYTTIPGWINFEQEVNLWELSHEKFKQLYN